MQQSSSADNPQPSDTDMAWLAGFIDGEGHFRLHIQEHQKFNKSVRPELVITNSSTIAVENVKRILGEWKNGCYIKLKNPKRPRDRKQVWSVQIAGYKRLGHLLPLLIPHLINKQIEAELLNAFIQYRSELWKEHRKQNGMHNGIEYEIREALKALHREEGSETKRVAANLIEKIGQKI
jgi:hypothetical protein